MLHNDSFALSTKKKLDSLNSTLNLSDSLITVRESRFEKLKKVSPVPAKPWEIAQNFLAKKGTISLQRLVEEYMENGLVFSTSNVLLLAKEINWNPENKSIQTDILEPNAWFVELCCIIDSSKFFIKDILNLASQPRLWAVWMRRNKYKAYTWEALRTRF
jgi:hypothetical protein